MLNARTRKKDNTFCFDDIYGKVVSLETSIKPRSPQFRMSSAPFCSLRSIFEWLDYVNDIGSWSFKGDFYTGIGTATHSNLQKWIPLVAPAQILGHWRCKRCCVNSLLEDCVRCTKKCEYFIESVVGPQRCPKCGHDMTYQEFQFLLPGIYASGHSDGILLYDLANTLGVSEVTEEYIPKINKLLRKDKIKIPAYILEYKTTSKNKALYLNEPLLHHKAQATMYASAARRILPEKYGLTSLDIKGILVKYIARDTPDIRSRDFIIDVPDDSYYMYNVNMIKRATKAIRHSDSDLIFPKKLPCKDGEYKSFYSDCPYTEVCSEKRKNKKEIQKIIDKIQPAFVKELKVFKRRFNHPE